MVVTETELTQKHPQWIGAWWLGFIINTIANFILFIPMSMLPKNLRPIKRSSSVASSSNKGKEIAWEEEQEDGNGKMNGEEKRREEKDDAAEKEHEDEQNNKNIEEQE